MRRSSLGWLEIHRRTQRKAISSEGRVPEQRMGAECRRCAHAGLEMAGPSSTNWPAKGTCVASHGRDVAKTVMQSFGSPGICYSHGYASDRVRVRTYAAPATTRLVRMGLEMEQGRGALCVREPEACFPCGAASPGWAFGDLGMEAASHKASVHDRRWSQRADQPPCRVGN